MNLLSLPTFTDYPDFCTITLPIALFWDLQNCFALAALMLLVIRGCEICEQKIRNKISASKQKRA